jgi:hypothetical protein
MQEKVTRTGKGGYMLFRKTHSLADRIFIASSCTFKRGTMIIAVMYPATPSYE